MSIYAAPEKWNQTHYALEVAVKMLDFYEEYFNIHYPLPKQGKLLFLFVTELLFFPSSLCHFLSPDLCFPSLRSDSHPRLQVHCNGKLGSDHLQRDLPSL